MSNNITAERKLAIKSELLRHMETVKQRIQNGDGSSQLKMMFLDRDMEDLEKHNQEPELEFWENWLAE